MQNINKPFAPFGAIFKQLRLELPKLKTCPYLFCGKNAYADCKAMWEQGHIALCLPQDKSIGDYQWELQGLNIILFDTGSMSAIGLKRIAYDILCLGSEIVCIHSAMQPVVSLNQLKKELVSHGRNAK